MLQSDSHSPALPSSSLPSCSFVDELGALLSDTSLDQSELSDQLSLPASEQRQHALAASHLITRLCALRDETARSAASTSVPLSSSLPSLSPSDLPTSAAVRLCASECSAAALQDEVQAAMSSARSSAARVAELTADCSQLRDRVEMLSRSALTAHSSHSMRDASGLSTVPPSPGMPTRSSSTGAQWRDTVAPIDAASAAVLSELQQRSAEIQHLLQVTPLHLPATLHCIATAPLPPPLTLLLWCCPLVSSSFCSPSSLPSWTTWSSHWSWRKPRPDARGR